MANWLRPRPLMVMALLLAAPVGAIAHLMITWAPGALTVKRITDALVPGARSVTADIQQLAQVQADTARLERLAAQHSAAAPTHWLPQRDRNGVSDTLAGTLQGGGVVVAQLQFDEASLYAATSEGELLACENVVLVCRGSYAGLADCLDRLHALELPVRITNMTWQRDETNVELTLAVQVPFVPEGELEAALQEEAGIEDEEDEL